MGYQSLIMIQYTRHAKRRMKLYNLSEYDIETVINTGEKEIISNDEELVFIARLPGKLLPVKVVCKLLENSYSIITCYLLKRGLKE